MKSNSKRKFLSRAAALILVIMTILCTAMTTASATGIAGISGKSDGGAVAFRVVANGRNACVTLRQNSGTCYFHNANDHKTHPDTVWRVTRTNQYMWYTVSWQKYKTIGSGNGSQIASGSFLWCGASCNIDLQKGYTYRVVVTPYRAYCSRCFCNCKTWKKATTWYVSGTSGLKSIKKN